MADEQHNSRLIHGWDPRQAADRSIQAFAGLYAMATGFSGDEAKYSSFMQDTVDSIEIIQKSSEAECVEQYKKMKSGFVAAFHAAHLPWLHKRDVDRVWLLFLERHHLFTGQLRANLGDMLDCFDRRYLAEIYGVQETYFVRLPLTTEFCVSRWAETLVIERSIPPRELFVDALLMLMHAFDCRDALNSNANARQLHAEENRVLTGKLDAYVRQVVILVAAVCDAALSDYATRLHPLIADECLLEQVKQLSQEGLTASLNGCGALWPKTLGRKAVLTPPAAQDMIRIIQIRNRLIHNDGRINAWHAFNLDLTNNRWGFSQRISYYMQREKYGRHNSFSGHEIGLAEFCCATLVEVLDYIHSLVFPGELATPWLHLPLRENGRLNYDEIFLKEFHRSAKVAPNIM
jgi:hypothetical protein